MPKRNLTRLLAGGLAVALPIALASPPARAQAGTAARDATEYGATDYGAGRDRPALLPVAGGRNDAYSPPPDAPQSGWRDEPAYRRPPPGDDQGYARQPSEPQPYDRSYDRSGVDRREQGPPAAFGRDERDGGAHAGRGGYGEPYYPPRDADDRGPDRGSDRAGAYPGDRYPPPPPERGDRRADGTFSMGEVKGAGHRFFGGISQGFAGAIEYVFQKGGRPNGYILGEDAGGAFIAGLRYGEGTLYTKDAGHHKVYWQGPSVGYDAGAEGSKVMVLVYNLRDPSEIYNRFGGVAGSAYVVGGVGITFQKNDEVTLAPIRAGVGFRLGANVGYLKYTRRPTWNPF